MEFIKNIMKHSLFCKFIVLITAFFGNQWQNSIFVKLFTNVPVWDRYVGEESVFHKIWNLFRNILTRCYKTLKFDKLLEGSIFAKTFLWVLLTVILAPFIPTMLVMVLAVLSTLSLLLQLIQKPEEKLLYSPMNRYIIFYGGLYLVASLFSVNLTTSIQVALLTAAFVLFAIIIQNAVKTQNEFDILVKFLVFAGTVVALYGIYQYLFRTGYQSAAWVDSDMFSSITFRVASTLDNPNMLGQYLILIIPLTGACLLRSDDWGERVFWLCIAGIQCLCMILTFSRGAWLGLMFAGMLFFLLIDGRFAYAIPVAIIVLLLVLPTSVIERFTSIGNISDASTSYRVFIWLGTLAMLKKYWLCGIGAGDAAFNLVYPAYSYNSIVAPHSHNLFLQMICDGGIFLLIIFLLMLFQYARGLFTAIYHNKDWKSKFYQIASISGVAGFMVQAMTDYSFYNYRVMFVFWVIIGVGGLAMNYNKLKLEKAYD